MNKDFETKLNKYAQLAIQKGAHVVSGQTIIIYADTSQDYLAEILTAKAYELGAAEVHIQWRNTQVSREFYLHADDSAINSAPEYLGVWADEYITHKNATRISIVSDAPDAFEGINPKRLSAHTQALSKRMKVVRDATMSDQISWLVMAAASKPWAKKVFPGLDEDAALAKLWDEIFTTVYVTEDNDPIQVWEDHINELKNRANWLNEKNFKELKYKSKTADITIGLAEHHNWEAASSTDKTGNQFIPNMPTEEVFTSPDNRNINGTITSTLPLAYQGNVIEGITLDFKDGQIISASAQTGEDVLEELIATDAGSKSLGEISLVPFHSPISQSGVLFYNTLFDENASNHLAIGAAYTTNIRDGKNISDSQKQNYGWNVSDVHEDFMVGSSDLDIDGITHDGQSIPVFRNGDWAN